MVVYKKLMGGKPTLEDLEDFNPSLYRGLKMLMDFDGDVEEVSSAPHLQTSKRISESTNSQSTLVSFSFCKFPHALPKAHKH